MWQVILHEAKQCLHTTFGPNTVHQLLAAQIITVYWNKRAPEEGLQFQHPQSSHLFPHHFPQQTGNEVEIFFFFLSFHQGASVCTVQASLLTNRRVVLTNFSSQTALRVAGETLSAWVTAWSVTWTWMGAERLEWSNGKWREGEKKVQYVSKPGFALRHYESQIEVRKWRPQVCEEGRASNTHRNAWGLN